MLYFELWTFARDEVRVMPWLWQFRAVAYGVLGVPGLLTAIPTSSNSSLMPPILGSLMALIVCVLTVLSTTMAPVPTAKEWAWPWFGGKGQKQKTEESGGKYESFTSTLNELPKQFLALFEKGTLPRVVFLTWYTLLNVVLGYEAYNRHRNGPIGEALRGIDPANDLLQNVGGGLWFPVAKLFGQLLNLNCTVMILPVVRSLVMKLHNISSFKGAPAYLRWIPFVLPLDKNIVFHKACAKYYIFVSVFGHATAHYMNYAFAPYYEQSLGAEIYNRSPTAMAWNPNVPAAARGGLVISAGFTGEALCIVMFIIFGGANDQVKRSHYETFWYSHHFFILWFGFLLFHGPVWRFWCLPALVPYVIDRLIRVFYRGRTPVALQNVFFWGANPAKPDVFTLQFDNTVSGKTGRKYVDYMEGHYLYVRCPAVEGSFSGLLKEWHPFTISSCPDENVLEINIRVLPSPHSWTNKVARYLALLDPQHSGHIQLSTRNPTTGEVTPGKTLGPDGKPFFFVDAPHGAPSQHVFNYNTSVVVGAGIGVTPCSSIMKGVVNFRWKKGFAPNNLHFFWVARKTDLTTFKWLLVQLPELKAQELVHNDFYGGDDGRRKALLQQLEQARAELNTIKGGASGTAPATLPPGWSETRTPQGVPYYFNTGTGETSWQMPGLQSALPAGDRAAASQLRVEQLQAAVREASSNNRHLSITIYLTGCKQADLEPKPNAKPGSNEELITNLLSTKDPMTGEPYLHLKAGRPDWPGEFKALSATYGREDIGVIFCGAPAIAAALKESCEEYSQADKTIFRLHKENF